MNFSRRLGRFSDEFTPSPPKSMCAHTWLRRDGGKITEKMRSILEMAHREWLSNRVVDFVSNNRLC